MSANPSNSADPTEDPIRASRPINVGGVNRPRRLRAVEYSTTTTSTLSHSRAVSEMHLEIQSAEAGVVGVLGSDFVALLVFEPKLAIGGDAPFS